MKSTLQQLFHNLQTILLIVSIVLLCACATLPSHQGPYNQSLSWSQRKNTLKQINRWQIQGTISIRTLQQTVSASMHWKQVKRRYAIHLFGPLGLGNVIIHGQTNRITLVTAHKQTITSKNPEQLIQKELGWKLPVSNLYYWIRGIPVPMQPAKKTVDRYNHLTRLQQQGWTIQYLRYAGFHRMDLPTKIFLSYPGLSIRIVISNWKLKSI